MTKLSDIAGRITPQRHATVPLDDRGYLFADGVYEVAAYFNQRMVDGDLHLDRLERSLKELDMPMPFARRVIELRIARLIEMNRRQDGIIYLQVTRGIQRPRNHVYPKDLRSFLTMQILPARPPEKALLENGVAVVTTPDIRWARCDIKTICLLPNILSRQAAVKAKAREAWQVNAQGEVTEGTLSNAYIITQDNVLRTHPATHDILGGITRDVTLRLARDLGFTVEEKAFTVEEAYATKEAFLTSATSNVLPITSIDGNPIANGSVGEMTTTLSDAYHARIQAQTGKQL